MQALMNMTIFKPGAPAEGRRMPGVKMLMYIQASTYEHYMKSIQNMFEII